MNKPILSDNLKAIIYRLNRAGYRADIVGGCVRDFLLGKNPCDYDLTTDATPDEMRKVFSDMRTLDIGIKHGTLTVLLDGEPFEITTYRCDGEYVDHRHPSEVSFTRTLSEDLKRRDFTMNAICYNEKDGFTDLFSGIDDIKNSIVRAVGDPDRRFDEDALRILRAVRFASVLGFDIEEETSRAALRKKALLSSVSGERIAVEWQKLLCGVGAYQIIDSYSDIFLEFIPLKKIILPTREAFDKARPPIRELIVYALSSDEPHTAFLSAAERMRYDNKSRKFGVSVLSSFSAYKKKEMTRTDIKLLMHRIGKESTLGTLELLVSLGRQNEEVLSSFCDIISGGEPWNSSDLCINGNDLINIGIKGKAVGDILERLIISVIRAETENERDALIEKAKSLYEN